jgi:hypothetical protein
MQYGSGKPQLLEKKMGTFPKTSTLQTSQPSNMLQAQMARRVNALPRGAIVAWKASVELREGFAGNSTQMCRS